MLKSIRKFSRKMWKPARQFPRSLGELRALHIGGYWRGPNDVIRHMMLGLQATGAQVLEYDTDLHPEALDTGNRPYDRGTYGPVWIREECMAEAIDQWKPHIIVCNAGGLSFLPEVAERLRRSHFLLGIAASDPDVFKPTTHIIAPNFDLFLTNDPSMVPRYRELGVNAARLPPGTNEAYWRPLPSSEEYRTDVLILSRALPKRFEPVREIVKHFDTIVYGEGWQDYGIASRGIIYGDESLRALNSAKIVPVFLQNPDGSTMFVKAGIFDFPAAGALVITNDLPDVERYLRFGKEIIGFASTPDLISKIEYYLAHPDEAEVIRKAGHLRVRQEHTWAHAWRQILSQFLRIYG